MSVLRYGLPAHCPLRLKEEDPSHSSIDRIKVVFNDCLRLLTNRKREDRGRIEDMLEELGWLSINQLNAETRLLEAWKSIHTEGYYMSDLLQVKPKNQHMGMRANDETLLEQGPIHKFANGSFIQRTAQIWNAAHRGVKEASSIYTAKRTIRQFVKTLPL